MKAKSDVEFPGTAPRTCTESRTARELWILLGGRRGDNLQMTALAEATGLPFRAMQLRFNAASALPNWLLGASRLSATCDEQLGPPWPAAVISSGRRAVPLAMWIRKQSGETTRLIHVGRPWAPLSWFDLVVTTPQYRLPSRGNVLRNSMPLSASGRFKDAGDPGIRAQLRQLPRPHVGVFVGGNSRPYVLDGTAAHALAERSLELAEGGGSVIVVAGPRTPIGVLDALRTALVLPCLIFPWNAARNPYVAVRADADRLLVTIDSAAMLSELITAGAPVEVFPLPMQRDIRLQFSRWLEAASCLDPLVRSLHGALIGAGLLTSVRDLEIYVESLRHEGLLENAGMARARQARELRTAAARTRYTVLEPAPRSGFSTTLTRRPPRSGDRSNSIVPP